MGVDKAKYIIGPQLKIRAARGGEFGTIPSTSRSRFPELGSHAALRADPRRVPAHCLAGTGQGLLLATLPFYATELGVGLTMVSVIASAAAVGTLLTDVPAGMVLHRAGLRSTMLLGSALVVVGTLSLVLPLSPTFVVGL